MGFALPKVLLLLEALRMMHKMVELRSSLRSDFLSFLSRVFAYMFSAEPCHWSIQWDLLSCANGHLLLSEKVVLMNMESFEWLVFMIKGTFGTSQKTRPTRTAPHELIMLHSRLEVPNMFQSLGDLLLVVPFMLHGCKYKAMIRVYIYTYIYI